MLIEGLRLGKENKIAFVEWTTNDSSIIYNNDRKEGV